MPGTILENLSGRKLSVLVSILLVCQLTCFLVGLISPSPATSQGILSTVCVDDNPNADNINRWFTKNCPREVQLNQERATVGLDAKNLVSHSLNIHYLCLQLFFLGVRGSDASS